MSEPVASEELEALEAAVADDPAAPQFALLAEAYRRAGRLDDARRVAVAGLAVRPEDTAGRLALGLALLDLGEAAAARYELERAMGSAAGDAELTPLPERDPDATFAGDVVMSQPDASAGEGVADDELEAAFAQAESLPDEMLDANRIAAEAIVDGDLHEPEGFALGEAEAFEPAGDDFQLDEAPAFATETMARLLADQGDERAASAIRERMAAGAEGDERGAAEPIEAGPRVRTRCRAGFRGGPRGRTGCGDRAAA